MALDDLTLGQLADIVNEVRRLREQVTQLQAAGTREVERRRRFQSALTEALRLAMLYGGWNPEDITALRTVLNACPVCHAQGGEPCRTENVGAALPIPHIGRVTDLPDLCGGSREIDRADLCGGSQELDPVDVEEGPLRCPGCIGCAP